MMRRLGLGLFASVLCAGLASAEPTIELQGRYWFPDLRSNAQISSSSTVGTVVDLKDDLGVGNEAIPEGQLIWHITRKHELRAGANFATFNGSKFVTKNITFDGTTYAVGTQVNSELKLNTYNVGWAYQFAGNEIVTLKSILDVKIFDIDGTLNAVGYATENANMTIPLPTIGLGLEAKLPLDLAFCTEVTGMSAGDFGHLVDAELGLKYSPIKHISVAGGYRWVDFKGQDDDANDRVVLNLQGPYVNVNAQF